MEKHLFDIQKFHPDIQIEDYSIQTDHVHLVIIIPPSYSVSNIVGKLKANTRREIRKTFERIKQVYWRNEFWCPDFVSSTVGNDEQVIKRYVELQERADKDYIQLNFKFSF